MIPCVEFPQMDLAKDFSSPPTPFQNTGHTEFASSIYFLLTIGIVGTLVFGSPKRQVVGILIVSFPKHRQHNANLQKRRSGCNGLIASPMIKLEKIWRGRE